MAVILAKNWWSLVVRGLAAIVLGSIALAWRGMMPGQLALFFAGYAAIDGLVGLAGAVRAAESHERWVALVLEGLTGIVAAFIAFAWPLTDLSFIYVVAAWAALTGTFEILSALRLRKQIAGEWMLALSGIASLTLGTLMAALPLAGSLPIALWLGGYALIFGALLLGLGLRLRAWTKAGAASSIPNGLPSSDVNEPRHADLRS
ncbi:MAG: hypothetical protein JWO19_447 [Bryobacterales bacterium]|nr:hypothetical protein [Bryobacterales bacterium]